MTLDDFLNAFAAALADGSFVSLTLSGPIGTAEPTRQTARPVEIRVEQMCQWTAVRGPQTTHRNEPSAAAVETCRQAVGSAYRQANLITTAAEWEARVSRRGAMQVRRRAVSRPAASTLHDRAPRHLLPEGTPCPFLAELGVMTAEGRVRAAQQHKFRQINRYLEFVRDILGELPEGRRIEVVDCGCGKSGLTFAVHHYLTEVCGREVRIVGLDRNLSVLETCRGIAARLGCQGLEFEAGDIANYRPEREIDLVVSLHACDTATDAALAQAIAWQARVIFAVPCCQHELAPRLQSAELEGLLAHGLLRERFAADVTDALRAACLESSGYRTQIVEFIELEHTPKNLLLRAVRRTEPALETVARALARRERLKQLVGIDTFALERLLAPPAAEAPRVGDERPG